MINNVLLGAIGLGFLGAIGWGAATIRIAIREQTKLINEVVEHLQRTGAARWRIKYLVKVIPEIIRLVLDPVAGEIAAVKRQLHIHLILHRIVWRGG